MGYSVGGAAAMQAGLMDPRIVAVLNIDGGLFGPPADQIGPQAYFLLSSREAFPTEAELASPDPVVRNNAHISAIDIPRNKRRMERPRNYWAMIEPADHDDLADGLFALRREQAVSQQLPAFRHERRRSSGCEVAFFRSTLLGDDARCTTLSAERSDRALDQLDLADTGDRQGTAVAVGHRRVQPPRLRRALRRNREPRRATSRSRPRTSRAAIEGPVPSAFTTASFSVQTRKKAGSCSPRRADALIAATSCGMEVAASPGRDARAA